MHNNKNKFTQLSESHHTFSKVAAQTATMPHKSDLASAINSPYWQETFAALKIHLPTLRERNVWAAFVLIYGLSFASPTFYVLTEYSSEAVYIVLANSALPPAALDSLAMIVKGSAIVPIILGINLTQALVANITEKLHYFYQMEHQLGGLLKRSGLPLIRSSLPLLMAAISALGTANVTYQGLMSNRNLSAAWLSYFVSMTLITASLINFSLLESLLVRPMIKQWRRQAAASEQTVLLELMTNYSAWLQKCQLAIEAKNEESYLMVQNDLWDHFVAMREASSLTDFLSAIKTAVEHSSCISVAASQPIMAFLWYGLKTSIFGVFSSLFTLPNLISGLKAGDFVKSQLGLIVPGVAIGITSFCINGLINYIGMWSLWNTGVSLSQQKNRLHCNFSILAIGALKLSLVSLYVASQIGLVLAFPVVINARLDKIMALLQLIVTAFASMGLAFFSINSAIDKGLAYQSALDSRLRLQSSTKPLLTAIDCQVMMNYLTLLQLKLTDALQYAPLSEVQQLAYCLENERLDSTNALEQGLELITPVPGLTPGLATFKASSAVASESHATPLHLALPVNTCHSIIPIQHN